MQLMTRRGVQVFTMLALAASGACEKKAAKRADQIGDKAAELQIVAKPAAVDVAKLSVPALFASIPAETPYVLAAFEAVPLEYYAKLKDAFGSTGSRLWGQLRASAGNDEVARVLTAVEEELAGKMDAKGFESLGFSATPRFALYGLGLAPVVFRLEVGDDKVLLATIQRVATKAGLSLPAAETREARSFWRLPIHTDETAILALADNQLVVAYGRTVDIEAKLGLILGSEKPAQSMASGKPLIDLMVKHGFGPHMVGYADTKKLAVQGFAYAGQPTSPACVAEIDRLSARIPRFVMGYSKLTGGVVSGGAVIELAPDLVAALRAARADVPGLAEGLKAQSLMAFALAADIDAARTLGLAAAGAVRHFGEVCELEPLVHGAAGVVDAMSKPLPPFIAGAMSVLLVARDITFGASGGPPERVDGYIGVTTKDARALYGVIEKQVASLASFGVKPDGNVYPVTGLPLPYSMHAGIGTRTIAIGVGPASKRDAETLVDAHTSGTAPFFVMSYDYGKFLALQANITKIAGDPADPGVALQQELNTKLAAMFGRAVATLDVGDHGLAFWGTMEMK